MIIFGAVDFSSALAPSPGCSDTGSRSATHGRSSRRRAASRAADEVVVEWPDRYLERDGPDLGARDAVCVLTHDTKFDVPAIVGALATEVGYIGAMGSRRTKEKRDVRLREAGVTDDQLARVHAPIGLDIGARTPEETAVSICAEIIATRDGNDEHRPTEPGDGSDPPSRRSAVTTAAVVLAAGRLQPLCRRAAQASQRLSGAAARGVGARPCPRRGTGRHGGGDRSGRSRRRPPGRGVRRAQRALGRRSGQLAPGGSPVGPRGWLRRHSGRARRPASGSTGGLDDSGRLDQPDCRRRVSGEPDRHPPGSPAPSGRSSPRPATPVPGRSWPSAPSWSSN